jgi:FAD/FMN-containing dehydrogenase
MDDVAIAPAQAGLPATRLGPSVIAELRSRLRGRAVLPGDAEYDEARRVWNGMADRRPGLVIRCATAGDVVEAVRLARYHRLLVSVRGGGHNIAGLSVCDGGLAIDLSPMRRIEVDPARRIARAEPGLRLGEFDAATQAHGLATTMGVASDTGIAGLTLGGGIGRLARRHGLACDNLLSAEVVLADGRMVTASEDRNPDLFWGLRGGGGNLGIVTAFEYRLHPVGPTVLGGLLLYDWKDASAALRHYRDIASRAPEEASLDAGLMVSPEGRPMALVSACHIGPPDAAEQALRPLREGGPRPVQDLIAPMSYLEVQCAADPLFTPGRRYYWKSHFLRELGDAAIAAMLDSFAATASPMSIAVLQQLGGAIARRPADATAYGHRDAAWDCFPIAIWEDPARDAANIAWARGFWEAMRPFATGGVYVNNLGEEGELRIRAAYGANYARLAALKAKFDPDNLFSGNQNIRPRQE